METETGRMLRERLSDDALRQIRDHARNAARLMQGSGESLIPKMHDRNKFASLADAIDSLLE